MEYYLHIIYLRAYRHTNTKYIQYYSSSMTCCDMTYNIFKMAIYNRIQLFKSSFVFRYYDAVCET